MNSCVFGKFFIIIDGEVMAKPFFHFQKQIQSQLLNKHIHIVTDICPRTIVFKNKTCALAGVAQWTACRPTNQRVVGLIPGQGTCLGCGTGPQ